jgi:hypothetical protein
VRPKATSYITLQLKIHVNTCSWNSCLMKPTKISILIPVFHCTLIEVYQSLNFKSWRRGWKTFTYFQIWNALYEEAYTRVGHCCSSVLLFSPLCPWLFIRHKEYCSFGFSEAFERRLNKVLVVLVDARLHSASQTRLRFNRLWWLVDLPQRYCACAVNSRWRKA